MVAEGKMANVFICMLQFGKFLKLYFFLFQLGPQSALMLQRLPKLVKGKAGRRGERAFPSLSSWITIPTSPSMVFFMLHTPEASSSSSEGGRYEGNSPFGLKPASLLCVFWLICLTPFLIGVLPRRH